MAENFMRSIRRLSHICYTAKAQGNITLGSSLTAGENSSWASPSGDFAFGFQPVGDAGDFLLSIWFNKIPEKTIVWSAKSNNIAKSGSKLELTGDGTFLLNDPAGNKIWGPDSGGAAYAAMLDSGNLVLATAAGLTVWQSFDSPTDTLLPTQNLNQGNTIIASYSESNYSNGRFLLAMQNDGNLVLYTVNIQSDENGPYWNTSTFGSGHSVRFNESGLVYLVAENGNILGQIFPGNTSAEDFYQRVALDYDGVLRKYVYPRSFSSIAKSWPKAWSILAFEPSNICTSPWQLVGSGICGFNSVCQLGATDGRPQCSCPSGYIWVNSGNQALGCTPTFAVQNCDPGSEASNQSALVQMLNTDFPGSDYQFYSGVTEDWCREQCLADCFCALAIFRDGGCWGKRLPLSNGKTDPSVGGKAFVKIGIGNSTLSQNGDPKKRVRSSFIVYGSVSLGCSVLLNIVLLVLSLVIFFRLNKKSSTAPQQYQVIPRTNTRIFTYKELEEATDDFKEKVGQGASSTVYKGKLDSDSGFVVAVKKMDTVLKDGDKEFESEVSAIAGTNHRNLVQLVGYCNEGQHRLLVYEFMRHGSIADILFGEKRPSWFRRVQIAIGTARGINYLHEECSTQIIHCDIKSQNILLDNSYTARISDFGLAKLLRADQTRTITNNIRGTKGYTAPEWFRNNMQITVKADVYSFGIVLLELVCCRKCWQVTNVDENQFVLADWAYDCYHHGRIDELVGEDDDARDDLRRVEKYIIVAIWCIQEDPSLRPPMKKVIQMLEGSVEVAVPPDPSSYISSI